MVLSLSSLFFTCTCCSWCQRAFQTRGKYPRRRRRKRRNASCMWWKSFRLLKDFGYFTHLGKSCQWGGCCCCHSCCHSCCYWCCWFWCCCRQSGLWIASNGVDFFSNFLFFFFLFFFVISFSISGMSSFFCCNSCCSSCSSSSSSNSSRSSF